MWIFTTRGFISVVADRDNPDVDYDNFKEAAEEANHSDLMKIWIVYGGYLG